MWFKIHEKQIEQLAIFARENLLTKHGEQILRFLDSLTQLDSAAEQSKVPATTDEVVKDQTTN